MANDEHMETLKQRVKAWKQWRISNPHIRLDLRWEYLRKANLSKADLTEANLDRADLSETNLDGAHLGKAILQRANLTRANLTEADLSGADLSGANLIEANLDGANFNGANLSRANLGGVNLRRADLTEANLIEANLSLAFLEEANFRGADLSKASIGWTIFANNDLSTVKGLETVDHRGPSTIGVDTLFKSHGNIPEIFLRGAGLPEDFITYIPSLTGRAIEFYSCFISYSHADKGFARRLHDALQGRGIRCWLDEHQLLPGEKLYTEIDRGIRLWDKVLLCCSKASLTSWWVDNEIKIAFDKEQHLWRERGKEVLTLIPLDLDNYLFSGAWKSGLGTEVKARIAADFTGWKRSAKKFDKEFERLVKALRTDDSKEIAPVSQL